MFGFNSYGRYATASAPISAGAQWITVPALVRPRLRWDFTVSIDGEPVTQLPDQVQLAGMSPWTGISVGIDARGPVFWDLRQRRGTFRYTGGLRAVVYTPGAVRVPETTVRAIDTEAELVAE